MTKTLKEEFDELNCVRYCSFHYADLLAFIESKVREGEARGRTEKDVLTMTEALERYKNDRFSSGWGMAECPDVTRVEVINKDGRAYVNMDCSEVKVSMQDDGRTLKVFLK